MDRDRLRKELTRDEGQRLVAYQDSLGFWTIGVGHLLGSSPRMSSVTFAEAQALLDLDIGVAEALARGLVPEFDTMSDDRQRALVNLAFNRGNHLTTSTQILPAIQAAAQTQNEADWAKVPAAIKGTQWATQVGARADRLSAQFYSPPEGNA